MLEKFVEPVLMVLVPLGFGFFASQIRRIWPIFRILRAIVIWVVFPVLIFGSVAVLTITKLFAMASSAVLACLALGVSAALSAMVVYWGKMGRKEGVSVLLNSTFMNYTFLGLAVVYAITRSVEGLAAASIFAVTAGVIHLTVGFALTASMSPRGRAEARSITYSFLTFPPAFALIAAILFVGFGASPPGGYEGLKQVVGIFAGPGVVIMSLVAGSQMFFSSPIKHLRRLASIGAVRLVACPLAVYGFIFLMDVREIVAHTALIQAIMPPGVFNLILAQKFDLDMELYGPPVFYLTILSLFVAIPLLVHFGF